MPRIMPFLVLALASLTAAGAAIAHPGHVTPVDGHAHWLAIAAVVCIIGAAIVALGQYAVSRARVSRPRRDSH